MKKIITLSTLVAVLLFSGCGDSMNSEQVTALKAEISKMTPSQKLDGYGEAILSNDDQKKKIYESFMTPEQIKAHETEMTRLKKSLNDLLMSANNPNATRTASKQLANTYEQLLTNPKIQNWDYYKNEFKPAAEKILGIKPQGK
ncbi:MAG: hypothetical protein RBR02_09565 [Desulfuromonadaceae bacterium]|nr:hypothetical protein [Desulfuromonadaceae bacterium]